MSIDNFNPVDLPPMWPSERDLFAFMRKALAVSHPSEYMSVTEKLGAAFISPLIRLSTDQKQTIYGYPERTAGLLFLDDHYDRPLRIIKQERYYSPPGLYGIPRNDIEITRPELPHLMERLYYSQVENRQSLKQQRKESLTPQISVQVLGRKYTLQELQLCIDHAQLNQEGQELVRWLEPFQGEPISANK
ncbi:MAG TPA: hypothetical protein ENI23_02285 [bacterium]|nr:hypothetical protein [bacterium]